MSVYTLCSLTCKFQKKEIAETLSFTLAYKVICTQNVQNPLAMDSGSTDLPTVVKIETTLR